MYLKTRIAGILLTMFHAVSLVGGIGIFVLGIVTFAMGKSAAETAEATPGAGCGALQGGFMALLGIGLIIVAIPVIIIAFASLFGSVKLIKKGSMNAEQYQKSIGGTIAFVVWQSIILTALVVLTVVGGLVAGQPLEAELSGILANVQYLIIPAASLLTGIILTALDISKNAKDIKAV
ncbi:MAG: hypothetical protein LBP62_01740 [Clostridiales bacterium]|jgi:hypothetical protein|nr:hypothetical protein [Clostridiales bacterium]